LNNVFKDHTGNGVVFLMSEKKKVSETVLTHYHTVLKFFKTEYCNSRIEAQSEKVGWHKAVCAVPGV